MISAPPGDSVHPALAPGVRRREVFGWAMFDFANSSYTTVVITAVFNAYFVATVAGGAPWATLAWTSALAVSYALIMLTAPVIGAFADLRAAKKRLMLITTIGCVACTAALALAGPGSLALAVVMIVASNWFFSTGVNVNSAFLPELARGESLGRVSGWGWGLGYIGGLLALAVCVAWVMAAEDRGEGPTEYVPATMLITAGFFALAAIPTFAFLRERAEPQAEAAPLGVLVRESFARLGHTIRHALAFRDLATLLACIVCYQAGIQTVVALAAVYAQEALGFDTRQTLMLVLVVNITAAVGAFLFGPVQDRLGHRASLALILVVWLATVLVAWRATDVVTFWVAANLAGFGLGAAQSAGRALVGYLSPEHRRAEFFGLWGLAINLASIIGPMTYGAVTWLGGGDHRLAMLTTGLFFIAGLAVLAAVDVARGRAAALADRS
jgi:UMF1 family MFS transporter